MDTFASETRDLAHGADRENGPPDEFVKATKDALDHLYDFTRLNHHRLAHWLLPGELPRGVSRAQALRQMLVDAIEHLNAGSRLATSARQSRAFHLLELRYLEAMSFREVMRTFALSQTQYHREQRHAIDMVAEYLWGQVPEQTRQVGAVPPPEVFPEPRAALSTPQEPSPLSPATLDVIPGHDEDDEVALTVFLADIVRLLGSVAAQSGVRLRAIPAPSVVVATDRTILRSAVISSLGFLLGGVRDGEITLAVEALSHGAQITLRFVGPPRPGAADAGCQEKLRLSHELMRSIGGTVSCDLTIPSMVLGLPTRQTSLLVIDDNPDVVQLIARYLADQNFAVSNVGTVDAGLEAAQRLRPDVILLDVMLPHRDGWDALQLLQHHPTTAEIPIVVCTVLDEGQLAQALGARAFVRKPITRPELLQVLAETRGARRPPAEESRGDFERPVAFGSRSIHGPRSG